MNIGKCFLVGVLLSCVTPVFGQEGITDAFQDLKRKGRVVESESIMRVKASNQEMARLLESTPTCGYFCFPEQRENDIRSMEFLPQHWMKMTAEERGCYRGTACPGEFFTFQVGVFAANQSLDEVKISFSDLKNGAGHKIQAARLRCFNVGGIDNKGKSFTQEVLVPKGKLQAFWIGVDVPKEAKGEYVGSVTISPANAPKQVVRIVLQAKGTPLQDGGDREGWRRSRLRWLDSRAGWSDEPVKPYIPVQVKGDLVNYLGGQVTVDAFGLPGRIVTNYNRNNALDRTVENEVLRAPMRLVIETADGIEVLKNQGLSVRKVSAGKAVWRSKASNRNVEVVCEGVFEFDGWLDVKMSVKAKKELAVKDIRLEVPYTAYGSKYFMGLGKKGGLRSAEPVIWKWDTVKHQDEFWMGNVNAGLRMKFYDQNYKRPLVNIYYALGRLQMPCSWGNAGAGGITVQENPQHGVDVVAFSGARLLKKEEVLHYNADMLITPVKPLDLATQAKERFYHSNSDVSSNYISEALKNGANLINIHHKKDIYPFINYPYYDEAVPDFKKFIDEAHRNNLKVGSYYTTRELTVKIPEIWALRSLGGEVIQDGPGKDTRTLIHKNGPNSWLVKNFDTHFIPAWYNAFKSGKYAGDMDISVITTPDSRWNNYYLEGLDWMVKNIGLDGIYIDDSALDRETLKRGRRILDADGQRRTVDLHSWNHFNQHAGYANSLLMYMDLFPYIDRLWIGEGFEPTNSLDFWMVEISGIPFGLMSETLNSHNYWRGMVYGMTPRLPWSGDPTPLWKLFDDFGMENATMFGYWNEQSPVKSSNSNIPATVYVNGDKALVVLANWTDCLAECKLVIDEKVLGFKPRKASLPEMKRIQWGESSGVQKTFMVDGRKGLFILLEK